MVVKEESRSSIMHQAWPRATRGRRLIFIYLKTFQTVATSANCGDDPTAFHFSSSLINLGFASLPRNDLRVKVQEIFFYFSDPPGVVTSLIMHCNAMRTKPKTHHSSLPWERCEEGRRIPNSIESWRSEKPLGHHRG